MGRRGGVQRSGQGRVGGVGSGRRPGVGRRRHGGGDTTTTAQELHRRRRRRRRLGDDDAWGDVPTKTVEPKKASPKKPAARKVSPRKAPPQKTISSTRGAMINRRSLLVAPPPPRTRTTTPGARRSPFPWQKKPSVEDRRAQRRAELEAKRKARAAARASSKPSITKAAPPAPPADDGWGDDTGARRAHQARRPEIVAQEAGKRCPKGRHASLSKGMFSKDQKAAPHQGQDGRTNKAEKQGSRGSHEGGAGLEAAGGRLRGTTSDLAWTVRLLFGAGGGTKETR